MTSVQLSVVKARRCPIGQVMTNVESDDFDQVILELERADKMITTLKSILDDPNYREGARDHMKGLLETW